MRKAFRKKIEKERIEGRRRGGTKRKSKCYPEYLDCFTFQRKSGVLWIFSHFFKKGSRVISGWDYFLIILNSFLRQVSTE